MIDNKIDELIFQALPADFQFLILLGTVSLIYMAVSMSTATIDKLSK